MNIYPYYYFIINYYKNTYYCYFMFEIHCFAELYLGNAIEALQWEIPSFCVVYVTIDCVTSH